MKTENNIKGAYGSEFDKALEKWQGDPRSAMGSKAIGQATSSNEGGWVQPRDIGYSGLRQEDTQTTNNIEIKQGEVTIVEKLEPISTVKRVPNPMVPVIQELKRADGTTIKIRVPNNWHE